MELTGIRPPAAAAVTAPAVEGFLEEILVAEVDPTPPKLTPLNLIVRSISPNSASNTVYRA